MRAPSKGLAALFLAALLGVVVLLGVVAHALGGWPALLAWTAVAVLLLGVGAARARAAAAPAAPAAAHACSCCSADDAGHGAAVEVR